MLILVSDESALPEWFGPTHARVLLSAFLGVLVPASHQDHHVKDELFYLTTTVTSEHRHRHCLATLGDTLAILEHHPVMITVKDGLFHISQGSPLRAIFVDHKMCLKYGRCYCYFSLRFLMYVKDELYIYTVVECSLLIMGGRGCQTGLLDEFSVARPFSILNQPCT